MIEGERVDLVEASTRAKAEASRRQILRIKARERDVKVRWVSYDPLAMCDALGIPNRAPSADAVHNPATPGQVKALENFGMTKAGTLSKRQAGKTLDILVGRAQKGLATAKQVSWLIQTGIPADVARAMSKVEASAALDQAFGKRRA